MTDENVQNTQSDGRHGRWPVLPLRGMVVFPNTITPLDVGRTRSIAAVEQAKDDQIVLLAQRTPDIERPGPDDMYTVGTLANVRQIAATSDTKMRLIVEGVARVRVTSIEAEDHYDTAVAVEIEEPTTDDEEVDLYLQTAMRLFQRYDELTGHGAMPDEHVTRTMSSGQVADLLAAHVDLSLARRQQLLETVEPGERLEQLAHFLSEEIHLLELERQIDARVRKKMEQGQREYYLRERIQMLRSELGESDERTAEIDAFRDRIDEADMPEEARDKANAELQRLAKMPPFSQEGVVVRTYLEWLTSLPWNVRRDESVTLAEAESILNEDHFGLDNVKERIVEFLAVRQLSESPKSPILCLVGPPGVGKTSLGQSLARAMGRDFFRFSLGGVRDESEIRGHRRTYIGSMPGRIVQGLKRVGSKNPVILLDEIDKMTVDFRGDPAAALLEALDPEQNATFSDHYLEVPFDLSECVFVTTANSVHTIPPALLDRMEIISLGAYTAEEKLQIARRHLVPRALRDHGLEKDQLTLSDNALLRMIQQYTRESGVRELARMIAQVCRKAARAVLSGKERLVVNVRSLSTYLGPAPFFMGQIDQVDRVGIAHGLAYTRTGGDVIVIETTTSPGKGKLTLTGKLGEVMRESAQTAFSYIRSRAHLLGIDPHFHQTTDIHLHVPEGAVSKEGPSAGITMTVALISALTGRAVRWDVGMTGEMTLRGRILAVGGIKEKVLAGHRAGLNTILIPQDNEKDLTDVPASVRQSLTIRCIEHLDDVLDLVLSPISRSDAPADQAVTVPAELLNDPMGDAGSESAEWVS